jgi:hypothetical protein
MTDNELFALIKRVDPRAMRIPPGIRKIADEIERAAREAVLKEITEAFHASVVAALREGS